MVNMPHWSWIKGEKPKWKPLHERLVDEMINGMEKNMVKCRGCEKSGNCEKEKEMDKYNMVEPALVARFSEHDMCWVF